MISVTRSTAVLALTDYLLIQTPTRVRSTPTRHRSCCYRSSRWSQAVQDRRRTARRPPHGCRRRARYSGSAGAPKEKTSKSSCKKPCPRARPHFRCISLLSGGIHVVVSPSTTKVDSAQWMRSEVLEHRRHRRARADLGLFSQLERHPATPPSRPRVYGSPPSTPSSAASSPRPASPVHRLTHPTESTCHPQEVGGRDLRRGWERPQAPHALLGNRDELPGSTWLRAGVEIMDAGDRREAVW